MRYHHIIIIFMMLAIPLAKAQTSPPYCLQISDVWRDYIVCEAGIVETHIKEKFKCAYDFEISNFVPRSQINDSMFISLIHYINNDVAQMGSVNYHELGFTIDGWPDIVSYFDQQNANIIRLYYCYNRVMDSLRKQINIILRANNIQDTLMFPISDFGCEKEQINPLYNPLENGSERIDDYFFSLVLDGQQVLISSDWSKLFYLDTINPVFVSRYDRNNNNRLKWKNWYRLIKCERAIISECKLDSTRNSDSYLIVRINYKWLWINDLNNRSVHRLLDAVENLLPRSYRKQYRTVRANYFKHATGKFN